MLAPVKLNIALSDSICQLNVLYLADETTQILFFYILVYYTAPLPMTGFLHQSIIFTLPYNLSCFLLLLLHHILLAFPILKSAQSVLNKTNKSHITSQSPYYFIWALWWTCSGELCCVHHVYQHLHQSDQIKLFQLHN